MLDYFNRHDDPSIYLPTMNDGVAIAFPVLVSRDFFYGEVVGRVAWWFPLFGPCVLFGMYEATNT